MDDWWIFNYILHKEFLYIISRNNPENKTLLLQYKNYEKTLRKVISLAKKFSESDEANRKWSNAKKMWDFINTKLGSAKKLNTVDHIISNNQKLTKSADMANAFHDYFVDVGLNLANQFSNTLNEASLPDFNKNKMYTSYTNRYEIENIILKMSDKQGGVDCIFSKVIKLLNKSISLPLEHIFNKCIYLHWKKS